MHLSVIIPSYNGEKRLEATLPAVFDYLSRQSYEWEVIIVSDGSKDKTGDIADKLANKDNRITVIHHRPNRGYGAALKSGLYTFLQ